MRLGHRIRELRIQGSLSQTDVEEESGLARGYLSRVEGGREVPSLEVLEELADSLHVPLVQLFCDAHGHAATPHLRPRPTLEELAGVGPRQAPGEAHAMRRGPAADVRILSSAAIGLFIRRSLNRRSASQHYETERQDTAALTSRGGDPRLWR
jgi:transcriptional regulator with XRE-family HTH domain